MPASRTKGAPLVSVITPTYGRPELLRHAVEMFLAYRYQAKEMIIVDDSPSPASLPSSPLVKYIRLKDRLILGAKHNIAIANAQGEIIVHQDDDDLFSRRRLEAQLEPIVLGQADLTGFPVNYVLSVPDGSFFHFRRGIRFNLANEPDAILHFKFHDSASAYHRRVLDAGIRYPAWAGGEKAAFLNWAIEKGFRHLVIPNHDHFVYVRHRRNTWHYRDWLVHTPATRPWWFSESELAFYRKVSA